MKFKKDQKIKMKMGNGSWQPGVVKKATPVNKRILVRSKGSLYGILEENCEAVEETEPTKPAPAKTAKPANS